MVLFPHIYLEVAAGSPRVEREGVVPDGQDDEVEPLRRRLPAVQVLRLHLEARVAVVRRG